MVVLNLRGMISHSSRRVLHMMHSHSREWGWIHSMVDHSIREILCRTVMREMHMAQLISSQPKRRNPA